jgi:hypothetical protein
MRGLAAVALVAVGLWGCAEPVEGTPEEGMPDAGTVQNARLSLTAEVDQPTAPVASKVHVTATVQTQGAPQSSGAGQLVNFVVVSGGGRVFAGSAVTNDTGVAREVWQLGTTAGDQVLEVRAVEQTTGEPLVFATVTATATPGPVVQYRWSPHGVGLEGGALWDSSGLLIWGEDFYGNFIPPKDVPQGYALRTVSFVPGGYRGAEPTCTVSGTLINCPKPTGDTPDCTECFWGDFRAMFDTAVGIEVSVDISVR